MTDWYSTADDAAVDRVVAAWPSAPVEDLEQLGFILTTAREQVVQFAPVLPVTDPPTPTPDRYIYAHLQQAINLWNASSVSTDGDMGAEGYTFTPRPLDKTIRDIIRPVDIRPDVY